MVRRYAILALGLGAALTSFGQDSDSSLTVDERLAALEIQYATLDTRLNARTKVGAASLGSSETGLAAQFRIDTLECQVNDLSRAVRGLTRQVDMKRPMRDAKPETR